MKNSYLKPFLSVVISFSILICINGQNTAKKMDKLKNTIEAFDEAWNAIDLQRAVEFFADNAMLLLPNRTTFEGKKAIRGHYDSMAAWAEYVKSGKWEYVRDKLEVKMEGNMAFEVVNVIFTFQKEGEELFTENTKYIHIWEKQDDGSWKVIVDMFSRSDPVSE